jgi:branched-chain amino acid transport system substrate-binding protein
MRFGSSVVLSVLLVAGSVVPATSAPSGPPVRLTAILSTTGRYATQGEGQRNAVQLAQKTINSTGGINGHPVEIEILDDQGQPEIAQQLATQAVGGGTAGIICCTSNAASAAVARVATQSKVVQIFETPASEIWNTRSGVAKYVFETTPRNELEVPALLAFMKKRCGTKKAAIVHDENSYGQEGDRLLNALAKDSAIDIVDSESYPGAATDFTPQLEKVKSSGADTLFIWGAATAPGLVARGIKQLGLNVHVAGGTGILSDNFLRVAGTAGENIYSDTSLDLAHPSPVQRTFLNAYHDQFHARPSNFASYAYDATMLFAYALRSDGGKTDGDAISAALEHMKPLPLSGGLFHYTAADHNGLRTSDIHFVVDQNQIWMGA